MKRSKAEDWMKPRSVFDFRKLEHPRKRQKTIWINYGEVQGNARTVKSLTIGDPVPGINSTQKLSVPTKPPILSLELNSIKSWGILLEELEKNQLNRLSVWGTLPKYWNSRGLGQQPFQQKIIEELRAKYSTTRTFDNLV